MEVDLLKVILNAGTRQFEMHFDKLKESEEYRTIGVYEILDNGRDIELNKYVAGFVKVFYKIIKREMDALIEYEERANSRQVKAADFKIEVEVTVKNDINSHNEGVSGNRIIDIKLKEKNVDYERHIITWLMIAPDGTIVAYRNMPPTKVSDSHQVVEYGELFNLAYFMGIFKTNEQLPGKDENIYEVLSRLDKRYKSGFRYRKDIASGASL